ncbi:MAG: tRNA (adenosine(37)-N6)-threonylcarbamoyltransferase complex transferase subunit TsaD [Lachnospirales bacterium]
MKDYKILGIETSCDETSASVVVNGRRVLSNIITSQIDIHKKYGGVVPEIASRNHINVISQVVDAALLESSTTMEDIDAIAVTYAPGLEGALLVGLSYGKALAFSANKKLIGINHIEGHIFANFLENENLEPPFIALIVSGGHTHIAKVLDYGKYQVLGKTRDDAIGEAYDKVARVLGLEYPGGPKIDALAKKGDPDSINFPKIYLDKDSLDFSFSGLKSSVLNYINSQKMKNIDLNKANIAASFQKAAIEVAVNKTLKAAEMENINKIVLAGGVAANSALRFEMENKCKEKNIELNYPSNVYCTDNGAMIASCGYYKFINNEFSDFDLNAKATLKLGDSQ